MAEVGQYSLIKEFYIFDGTACRCSVGRSLLLTVNRKFYVSADDKRELLNYRDAFGLVSEYLMDGSPITEMLVREIHRKLVDGVRGGEGKPGQYRKVQNYVVNSSTGKVVYTPPSPVSVPSLMAELVEYLNMESDVHPVLVAGLAQFQLVHIHPFIDGNGRTSRLLSTLYLYRHGYDIKRLFNISEYYDRNRIDFYNAIQSVRNNDMNYTSWLDYFTVGLATQLEEAKDRGKAIIKTDLLARDYSLNTRQRDVLFCCADSGSISISGITEQLPDVPRRTLQRYMSNLVKLGLLDVSARTNNKCYSFKDKDL
jgi:Fic family protein